MKLSLLFTGLVAFIGTSLAQDFVASCPVQGDESVDPNVFNFWAKCYDESGNLDATVINLNECVGNNDGVLVGSAKCVASLLISPPYHSNGETNDITVYSGEYSLSCTNCNLDFPSSLTCWCLDYSGTEYYQTTIDLSKSFRICDGVTGAELIRKTDSIISNNNGALYCFGITAQACPSYICPA